MTKYIVVVGGVISGVGKGVASASIGKIMKEYGFSVTAVKIDPYFNCDAGTLRPTEHGEVWVTEDGGETDQDLGTYERFLGIPIMKKNSVTSGQIYKSIIEKERKGEFLGETVQFIPHVPEEIKNRIKDAADDNDICLVEIGGTIGDYENLPFLLAVRNLEREVGKENIIHVLVTYLPTPSHIEEMKTKPTQMSIKLMEEAGIRPDIILCRGKNPLDEPRKKKIETYANVSSEDVISMPDVVGPGRPNTLYVVPLELEAENIGAKIMKKLRLNKKKNPDWSEWGKRISNIINPEKKAKIAIIGKYLDIGDYNLQDSYISVKEALLHSAAKYGIKLEINWINSKQLDEGRLKEFGGIIVPGGFGGTGVEGKINAIKFARENNVPFLGLCYGLQLAVVEFARNACGLSDANSTEIDANTQYPVIDILPEQKTISSKGGTMRLGTQKAILKEGSKVMEIYNSHEIYERHRHRYEVNPDYHKILEDKGLILSGKSPDGRLAEFIEIAGHRFFIGTQAHPEFKSSFLNTSPLFDAFVRALKTE